MPEEFVIVPSNGDGYVELARTKSGRLFRKHLLNLGTLKHPSTGEDITIDKPFVQKMQTNFKNNVCDIVQVPLANKNNEHDESPDRNIGEVVDIELKDDKVYAVLDVRDETYADKLGKTLLGASAMMHLDYTDTKTGTKVGPTLLHSCVTNRPYVTGLDNYEEIVAATADKSGGAVLLTDTDGSNARKDEDAIEVTPDEVVPSKETDVPEEAKTETAPAKPSLEELLTALKTDHNIDVTGLQAKAAEGDQATQLSNALVTALKDSGMVKLANADTKTGPSTEDVVGAVNELADTNVKLTNRVQSLEKRDAEQTVDALVKSGHIMPKQRDVMVELKLTNQTHFDALLPSEPVVKLTAETGVTPPKDAAHKADIDADIQRLAELANSGRKR